MRRILLFEDFNDYDRQAETEHELKRRGDKWMSYLDQKVIDVYEKYLKKYVTDEEWNILKGWKAFDHSNREDEKVFQKQYDLRNEAAEKLKEEDPAAHEEMYNEIRKLLDTATKSRSFLTKKKFALDKEFMDKRPNDPFYLKGDKDAKYLYHFTKTYSAFSIIEQDEIIDNSEGISFTTNRTLLSRNPVFWHPNEYSEGVTYKNLSTCLVLDFVKMKADGIKFKLGSENLGTHGGEEEIRAIVDSIEEVSKYIVKVIYDPTKEKNKDDENKLLDLLKEKNIHYYIRKKK